MTGQETAPARERGLARGGARHRRRGMLLGALAGIVLTAALITLLQWPHTEVVERSREQSTTLYADDSRHYLGLLRERTLSGAESYRLMIGRDPGLGYGHLLEVDAALGAEGIERTEWTKAGVRVRFGTGHTLFVPAKSFMFGR